MHETPPPSDEELVEAILTAHPGCEDAWLQLLERCKSLLASVLHRTLARIGKKSLWEPEDFYQELYLHLRDDDWERLRSYQARPDSKFTTWLVVVARNLVYEKHRRKQLPTDSLDEPAGEDGPTLSEETAASEPSPEEAYLGKQDRASVQEAIAQLRHKLCQEVIRRHYLWMESFEDIAEKLGRKAPAVRKMHQRNKEELVGLLLSKGFQC